MRRRPQNKPICIFKNNAQILETDGLTGANYFTTSWDLATTNGANNFANLYDFWRILSVKWFMYPLHSESAITSAGVPAADIGEIATSLDYTGANVPSSMAQVKNYDNCKITRGNRVHVRRIRPAMLRVLYDAASIVDAIGYEPAWRRWIRTTDRDVPHYGLLGAIVTTTPNNNLRVRIESTVTIQFKQRKSATLAEGDIPPTATYPTNDDENLNP